MTLEDGTLLRLVLKSPGREAPGSRAGEVKPGRVTFPFREAWVYDELLPPGLPGPPGWYGLALDRDGGPALVLERIDGVPLSEVAGPDPWHRAASWIGRFHAMRWTIPRGAPLLVHDRSLHRWWYKRAVEQAEREVRRSGKTAADGARQRLRTLVTLEAAHVRACAVLPDAEPTFVHGEFHPSNILVETNWGEVRIRPVDWEMAGLGPALMDLAALTAGAWTPRQRSSMAMAYRHAALAAGTACPPLDHFLWALDACGLLLAFQWLGWGGDWTPPPEHRTDWLCEAVRCARRLGT